MDIQKTENGNEVALAVSGCLDTASTPEFASALEGVGAGKTVVVDFTGTEFIASSALRQLVSAKKRFDAAGGRIVLAGMNEVVADVFAVTGLSDVFEIR